MSQTLIEILVSVSIIAVIMAIGVLWRLFQILTDIKEVSGIAKKRAEEIDTVIDRAKEGIINLEQTTKGFIQSLGIAKFIKQFIIENKK
jgi:hypothetical protein